MDTRKRTVAVCLLFTLLTIAPAFGGVGSGGHGADPAVPCFDNELQHFEPVEPTGLPYAIIIDDATADGVSLVEGDEIAVYDGDMCVGAMVVTGNWPLSLTAWEGDEEQGLSGFQPGNTMEFFFWQAEWSRVIFSEATYTDGDGSFSTGAYSQCNLAKFSYFSTVTPTGLPYTIIIDEITIDGVAVSSGDEVVVMETETSAGMTALTGEWPIILTAWEGDSENGLEGFRAGFPMQFEIWSRSNDVVFETVAHYTVGDGNFGTGAYSQLTLTSTGEDLPPLAFDLLEPVNATVLDVLSCTFRWHNTTDPDPEDDVAFELYLSTTEMFVPEQTLSVETDADTFFTTPVLLDDTDYWWKVLAMDSNTEGTWSSSVFTFSTAMPEPPSEFDVIDCGMTLTEDGDHVDVELSWNRATDPDPGAEELYAIYVDVNENMANQVLLADQIPPPAGPDVTMDWSDQVDLSALPGDPGDEFYFTVLALDDNTAGRWANNVVHALLSDVLEGASDARPNKYALHQNFPNPFNPTTTIRFDLVQSQTVQMSLYNMLGQQVMVLLSGQKFGAGSHDIQLDASNIASGSYLLKLDTPAFHAMSKVIVVK